MFLPSLAPPYDQPLGALMGLILSGIEFRDLLLGALPMFALLSLLVLLQPDPKPVPFVPTSPATPQTIGKDFNEWLGTNPTQGPWGGYKAQDDGTIFRLEKGTNRPKAAPSTLDPNGLSRFRDSFDSADDAGKKQKLADLKLWIEKMDGFHALTKEKAQKLKLQIDRDENLLEKVVAGSPTAKAITKRMEATEKERRKMEGLQIFARAAKEDSEFLLGLLTAKP